MIYQVSILTLCGVKQLMAMANHPSRTSEEQKLAIAVAEVINNGGSVLIPSFALGRAQEIILILKQAMETKSDPDLPGRRRRTRHRHL